MRPISVSLSAAGATPWIPMNRMVSSMWISLAVSLTGGASLTYSVQSTLDDLTLTTEQFSISRTTTTATVTLVAHQLSVGDWLKIDGAGAPFDGEFAVASVVDANTITYTCLDSGLAASTGVGRLAKGRVFDHDTLAGKVASATGNYAYCPWATRLKISSYTSGTASLQVLQGTA